MHSENGRGGGIRFDGIEIDVDGYRLRVAGVDIALERKAFSVLMLLARQPGRVFTRDEILDTVWGHGHVTPGVLNRVVTLVRQALGDSAEKPRYLHTVHGVGYRLDLPQSALVPLNEGTTGENKTAVASRVDTTVADVPGGSARTRRVAVAAWAVALLALLALGVWRPWAGRLPAPSQDVAPIGQHSIAVLPLVNVGGDPEQQFFADGLSENLIDVLSDFDGLHVIGRLSSFQFRDSNADSSAIGAKLGIAYLISGSVQRVGDTVRIHVELVSTKDGRTLWTARYDRPYKDLFALQDEIAMAISNALHMKLASTHAASQNDRPSSGNIDAYNAYLHGLQKFYMQELNKAIDYQEAATRLDPDYASAWAQLAVNWTLLGQYVASGSEAKEYFRKARAAVHRALVLQPDLGLAHGAFANLSLAADFTGVTPSKNSALACSWPPTAVRIMAASAAPSLPPDTCGRPSMSVSVSSQRSRSSRAIIFSIPSC
jgi:TolB-like protein/DNA-binding winged helix-turn-helix (wHTH) protein